jgi:alpha-L-arabinofuranosidase
MMKSLQTLVTLLVITCANNLRADFGDIAFTAAMQHVAPPPSGVTAGLVRHWALDEGSGTTAADSSGNAATGTIVGAPTWVAGRVGAGALSFSADSQYVTNRAQVTTTSNTFACWIYINSLPASRSWIVTGDTFNSGLYLTSGGKIG